MAGEWTYKSSKATYKVDGETLVTVSGVKSAAGLSLNGKTVIVSNAALNKAKITVSAGYTLELTITNLNSKAKKNDIDLGTDGTITLTENALTTDTKKAITLAGNGYKLATDDELTSAEQEEFWTISGTTATLKLTGLKKNLTAKDMDEIQIDDDTVTLDKDLLDKKKVTLTGTGYKLSDEGLAPETSTNWNSSKLVQASTDGYKLNGTGTNVSINAGKENDTIDLGDGSANQTFDIVDKKDKVLATYTAVGSNLLYGDNYGTQPQIDSLLAENADYSVGEIETSNGMNLTQEKTQLTFGKK